MSAHFFARGVSSGWGTRCAPPDGIAAGVGRRDGRQGPRHACARSSRRAVRRERVPQQGVVGQGGRQGDGARAGPRSAGGPPGEDALHPGPLQRAGPQGEHPQLADRQPSFRRRWPPAATSGRGRASTSSSPSTHGRSTKVPSLVLGCEKSNPSVHKNYSMIYSSHISWSSPDDPDAARAVPGPGLRPAVQGRSAARGTRASSMPCSADASDFAEERRRGGSAEARRVSRLGSRDRAVRIEHVRASRASCRAGGRRSTSRTSRGRPEGIPQNIAEHMRLMCDILVLGFQTDTTRVDDAQAQQRPQRRCGSRTWAWTT